jgi:oligopeptide transport system substrate-binding protein
VVVGGSAPVRPARAFPALAALLVLVGCTRPPAEGTIPGGTGPVPGPTATGTTALRLASAPVDSLDPRDLDSPDEILLASQVFDGLVAYHPRNQAVVPAAAERWDVLDDGRVFIFHLREEARFHDRNPVRAEDFVFAWNRLADPLSQAPFSFLLEPVVGFEAYQEDLKVTSLKGVTAPNERTLEVRLARPWPDFVSLLGHPSLSPVPPAADQGGFGQAPVGNGPYRVAEAVTANAPVQMQRFDTYYGEPPSVEQVSFQPFEEPEDAWPDFLAGELDEAPVPASVLADARTRFGEEGIVTQGRLLYCGFNQQDPRFRDVRLRQAVSMALDRESLSAGVFGGLAEPATRIVPPTLPGSDPKACRGRCSSAPGPAEQLVSRIPQASRSFALDYTDSTVGDRLAREIARQLQAVGLRVEPREHDEGQYQLLLTRDEEEFFCLVQVADYPRQQALLQPLFLSTSEDNQAGVDDPVLDRLLLDAMAEPAPRRRQELYAQAERRALTQMPVVPVVWFRSHLAVQPYVEGFRVSPLGTYEAAALSLAP